MDVLGFILGDQTDYSEIEYLIIAWFSMFMLVYLRVLRVVVVIVL